MGIKVQLQKYQSKFLYAGIGFVICALIISGNYLYKKIYTLQEVSDQRAEARETVFKIRGLKSSITDAESAQRGYLLTGNKEYLKPYTHAIEEIPRQLANLNISLANQPQQLLLFTELHKNIDQKLNELAVTVEKRQKDGTTAAVKIVNTKTGLIWMEEIRRISQEIDDRQLQKVDQLNNRMTLIIEESKKSAHLSSAFALLVTFTCFGLLVRHNRHRTFTEKELRRTNRKLESHQRMLSTIISIQEKIAAGGLSTRDIMRVAVQETMTLTQAEGAIIELIDGSELIYHYTHGVADQFLGFRIPLENSFSGLSLKNNEILICQDSEEDSRVNVEACRKVNLRSMIVVPLKRGETRLGVLKNYSATPHHFTEEHQKALFLINEMMSSALAQAVEFEDKNKLVEDLQKTKEDLTLSKNQAELATKAKSQFFASMSHEFRTPLNGILGMTNLLLDENLTPTQVDYAIAIKNSGDALLRIINDALDFSKIEAGKMELENVDFDLISTLQDLKKSFNFIARQKNIKLDISPSVDVPAFVSGDPGRVRQILTNLIGNALKFTPAGTVNVGVQLLNSSEADIHLRFDVKDSGVGIDQEAMKHLFRDFSQASISTTRHYGGTGLGLSISKSLVEQMSGEIGVISEIGKGSTFWFTIHLQPGRKVEILQNANISLNIDHEYLNRVLIAEDNPVNQTIIVKMLEKLQIRCDVAANGKEAIEALQHRPYDLILMDCNMPEMDGYEATHFIRTSPLINDPDIPIVAMTANAMKDDAERCYDAGMDDYIPKPLNLKHVGELMQKWSFTIRDRRKNIRVG